MDTEKVEPIQVSWLDQAIAKGCLPDSVLRAGIRWQLKNRLRKLDQSSEQGFQKRWIEQLRQSPIAIMTDAANEQHYEVPSDFFCQVLGRHMKYSSGNWAVEDADLDASEEVMLRLTMQRAEIQDGHHILELGCGWGSLSLEMARKFPRSQITAVSNSSTQKTWIDQVAANEGLTNLKVITANVDNFNAEAQYDRVVSVEMFEHLRNYEKLFERISKWLKADGKMFVHIFCHREYSYPFDPDPSSWMATYFFSGGIMPSENLFRYFDKHLHVTKTWKVSGLHYHRTCEAWLARADARKESILKLFEKTYGEHQAIKWFNYWRVFFLACSELFRFNQGDEWYVCHYLFEHSNEKSKILNPK